MRVIIGLIVMVATGVAPWMLTDIIPVSIGMPIAIFGPFVGIGIMCIGPGFMKALANDRSAINVQAQRDSANLEQITFIKQVEFWTKKPPQ